jgi:hypothetical protein
VKSGDSGIFRTKERIFISYGEWKLWKRWRRWCGGMSRGDIDLCEVRGISSRDGFIR